MTSHWVATWATSPMNVWAGDAVLYGFHNQTVRQLMRISKGGSRFCIRFSNEHGSSRIGIAAATIARSTGDGGIEPGSSRALTFSGRREGMLVGGAPLLSDPVDFQAADLSTIAISIYFSGFAPIETYHFTARQTAYISQFGNYAEASLMPVQQTSESSYFLGAAFVEADTRCRTIACFGDSITDGTASTLDANKRWPNRLAERLQESGRLERRSVANLGLDGNRILTGRGRGAAGLARFDRDVLALPNVSHVAILLGINDIGWPLSTLAPAEEAVSFEDIVDAYRQMIDRAHLAGIKAILGTLTPFGGAFTGLPYETFFSPEKERLRQRVNGWIRHSGAADAVIDFDAAVADDSDPPRLQRQFDCGDGLHPSDRGLKHMADMIDLTLFD